MSCCRSAAVTSTREPGLLASWMFLQKGTPAALSPNLHLRLASERLFDCTPCGAEIALATHTAASLSPTVDSVFDASTMDNVWGRKLS
jgi:hypothetical protein